MKIISVKEKVLRQLTLNMVKGICRASDGTMFSPLTASKTIYGNDGRTLDIILNDIEQKINGIVGGGSGGTSLPALQELITQLQNDKVNRAGDTMTGALTVPSLTSNGNITEAGQTLSSKYAPKIHNHNDLYYTETEINNKFANYYDKTASDGRYALKSHGLHVPAAQAANNKVFLRNDNTWQIVTPGNIGAAPANHTHTDLSTMAYVLRMDRTVLNPKSGSSSTSHYGGVGTSGMVNSDNGQVKFSGECFVILTGEIRHYGDAGMINIYVNGKTAYSQDLNGDGATHSSPKYRYLSATTVITVSSGNYIRVKIESSGDDCAFTIHDVAIIKIQA